MSSWEGRAHVASLQNSARAHFEGSKTPQAQIEGYKTLQGNFAYSIYAPQNLGPLNVRQQSCGPLKVCPAEFWSNVMCALLSHGDIITGA